jgi:hypothetical protein
MNFINTVLLAGSLASMAVGCSTTPTANPHTQAADTGPHVLEIDGLTVGIHPMTDKAEVKKTFKVNLAASVLPIKLTAENRNSTANFIIAKEKIMVISDTTGTTNSSPQGGVARDLTTLSPLGFAAMSSGSVLPFLFEAMNPPDEEVRINRKYEYNLASKEFYTRTLDPGQRVEGILFFRFQKGTHPSGAYHLIVQVKNTSSDVVTPLDFKFTLN